MDDNTANIYEHYSGKHYKILAIGIHKESREELVTYQALYPPYKIWARSIDTFFGMVAVGGAIKERFKPYWIEEKSVDVN